nr:40S ribosomal protein S12-like [Tanacetum cinerariifolium]
MAGEEAVVPVEVAAPAPALGEPMDIMTALQLVLRKSLAHGGLIRGLHEAAKVIEKHAAQICVLAEDCNQPDYLKLVKALCADHNVSLITVPSAKTLGEWAGLCKIDSEGKARKVVGCSCLVVKVQKTLKCPRRPPEKGSITTERVNSIGALCRTKFSDSHKRDCLVKHIKNIVRLKLVTLDYKATGNSARVKVP